MTVTGELTQLSAAFAIDGDLVAIAPFGNGHINDTYVATYVRAGQSVRYLHQRINHRVFADPAQVMANVSRVTAHLRGKRAGKEDRYALEVIPTRSGAVLLRTETGNFWRTYRFIEGTHCREMISAPEQAYQAARAFGRFQRDLADLPTRTLAETIPDFHNTPRRWDALQHVLARRPTRANRARAEIAQAQARRGLVHPLAHLHARGRVPRRVVHNDCKINNVLFDAAGDEAVCVIDLDTVMPGWSLHDFGDLVRTMTCFAPEDAIDPRSVVLEISLFDAVVQGYLEAARALLDKTELAALICAAETIIYEQGLRFLTDYLAGDAYYRTTRTEQNLDRCRTQFALLASIDQQRDALRRCVDAHVNGVHAVP
jgi:Ser/Thr protein kinase RdoA (MazF antagonist)